MPGERLSVTVDGFAKGGMARDQAARPYDIARANGMESVLDLYREQTTALAKVV